MLQISTDSKLVPDEAYDKIPQDLLQQFEAARSEIFLSEGVCGEHLGLLLVHGDTLENHPKILKRGDFSGLQARLIKVRGIFEDLYRITF